MDGDTHGGNINDLSLVLIFFSSSDFRFYFSTLSAFIALSSALIPTDLKLISSSLSSISFSFKRESFNLLRSRTCAVGSN